MTKASFHKKLGRWLATAILIGSLLGPLLGVDRYDSWSWNQEALANDLRSQGLIRVLTTENPAHQSFEKDLMDAFATSANIKINYIFKNTREEVIGALAQGAGDVAALEIDESSLAQNFLMTPAFETTHLGLYCSQSANVHLDRLGNARVFLPLSKNLHSFALRLQQLHPQVEVSWTKKNPSQILKNISEGNRDCAIIDVHDGERFLKYIPGIIEISRKLESERSIAWFIHRQKPELFSLLSGWLVHNTRTGILEEVREENKNTFESLSSADIFRFMSNYQSKLPLYKKAFKEAARQNGLDWKLIAAVAYQESMWDAEAVSFTGVVGLMQLTQDTATRMGIADRQDPFQSIKGGSAYLRFLKNQMRSIPRNKTAWRLALAAYNCGLGHLADARALTEAHGGSPSKWQDLRKNLPLLEDPAYQDQLFFGAARGRETVQFVDRVTEYHRLISDLDANPSLLLNSH